MSDNKKPDMSRAQQTKWIVGTLIAIAIIGGVIWHEQEDPFDPFSKCESFFEFNKIQCRADVAAKQLRGY